MFCIEVDVLAYFLFVNKNVGYKKDFRNIIRSFSCNVVSSSPRNQHTTTHSRPRKNNGEMKRNKILMIVVLRLDVNVHHFASQLPSQCYLSSVTNAKSLYTCRKYVGQRSQYQQREMRKSVRFLLTHHKELTREILLFTIFPQRISRY